VKSGSKDRKMRVVLDTNVWLSGLLWGGVPDQILQLVEREELQAIGSEEILDELFQTLSRPKLQKRLGQLGIDTDSIMLAVQQVIRIVQTEPIQVDNLRDPNDAMIIGAAIAGEAKFIITGDQDLLVLGKISGIEILSPRDFFTQNQSSSP
jgi:hypothetical protein